MPRIDHEKRARFAKVYAATGNAARAARVAGVPAGSARAVGYQWLRNGDVLELVRQEVDATLRDMAPAALRAIKWLIEDPATPHQTRLAAARDVLDRLGHNPPKRAELAILPSEKSLCELTIEELRQIAASGAREQIDLEVTSE
jgi:phage terminase small subunit